VLLLAELPVSPLRPRKALPSVEMTDVGRAGKLVVVVE
jgi:hypothetical protein